MLRATANKFPLDGDTKTSSALPWGILITPVAPSPSESAPRDILLGSEEPSSGTVSGGTMADEIPRCTSCGGYLSSVCRTNARFWRCALCHVRNTLPSRYTPSVLGESPLPAELAKGAYELSVDDSLSAALVPRAAYVFVVDETAEERYMDVMRVAVSSALEAIGNSAMVGIVMYGRYVSFLDVRDDPVWRRFHVDDPYTPVVDCFPPSDWLRPLDDPDVPKRINAALKEITPFPNRRSMHDNNPPRAMGAALERVLDCLEVYGTLVSRVAVLSAGAPNYGPSALSIDPDKAIEGSDRLPVPSTGAYAELGERAAVLGALVDMYIVSQMPVDLASLAPLAQLSGGRVLLYQTPDLSLAQDIWQHMSEVCVARGLMRVRTSPEFRVSEAYGCGVYRDVEVRDVYRLSAHGESSTMAVDFEFSVPGGFQSADARRPVVQIAFRFVRLAPGKRPERMLRVETRKYDIAAQPMEIRRAADANATVTLLFHKALVAADEHGVTEARMLLFDWLATLLARIGDDTKSAQDELLDITLSEAPALMSVPRLIFGLVRSVLFRQEASSPDARCALRCIWEDLSPEWLAAAAYPRLTAFASLTEKVSREVPLCARAVRESGHPIFLLDAFSTVVIYYAAAGLSRHDVTCPPPENSAVMKIQRACMLGRPLCPRSFVVKEGTSEDRWFKALLIEDAEPGAPAQSFAAFMQGVADSAGDIAESA